jgi:uncharacterized protein YbaP (TraB family)
MLWKIGGTNSYLMGTIHELRQSDEIPPHYFDIAKRSDLVFFEALKRDTKAFPFTLPAAPSEIVNRAMQKLSDLEEPYIDLSQQPSLDISTRVLEACRFRKQIYASLGVDAKVYQSVSEHIETRQLDDREFVCDYMNRIPSTDADKLAIQAIEDGETITSEFVETIEAWKAGDMEELERLHLIDSVRSPFLHSLTPLRNAIWVSRILEPLIQSKNILVCGGIFHFIGEGSILDLLNRKFASIRRV